jgi:hypothetical protein
VRLFLYVCGLLSLSFGVAALPAGSVVPLAGTILAAGGTLAGLFTLAASLFWRGTGAALGGGGVLASAVALLGVGFLAGGPEGLIKLQRPQRPPDASPVAHQAGKRPRAGEGDSGAGGRNEEAGPTQTEPTDKGRPAPRKPEEKKPREAPPAKTQPDTATDSELDRLVRGLRAESPAERVRAATELGKLKERGRPAARALCEAAVDPSEAVRQAALEALEKVRPDLYRHVLVLLVDADPYKNTQASGALQAMREDAQAAAPMLLAHLRWHGGPPRATRDTIFGVKQPRWDLARADIAALTKLDPTNPEFVKLLTDLSGPLPANTPFYGAQLQSHAVAALGEIGKNHPEQRKRIIPALIAAVGEEDRGWVFDTQRRLAAIGALGSFGPDAKEAVPALKKLMLHPQDVIRHAASSALEKIERAD